MKVNSGSRTVNKNVKRSQNPWHIQFIQALCDTNKIFCVQTVKILLKMAQLKPQVVLYISNRDTHHVSGKDNIQN